MHDEAGLTWFEAQAECAKEGGNLASIHSDEEHWEIWALVDHTKNYWLGLREYSWGFWGWVDDTPSNYGKWDVVH